MNNFNMNTKVKELQKLVSDETKKAKAIADVVKDVNQEQGLLLKALLLALNNDSANVSTIGIIADIKEAKDEPTKELTKVSMLIEPKQTTGFKVAKRINTFSFYLTADKGSYKLGEEINLTSIKNENFICKVKQFGNGHINNVAILCDTVKLTNSVKETVKSGLGRTDVMSLGNIHYLKPQPKEAKTLLQIAAQSKDSAIELERALSKCGFNLSDVEEMASYTQL